MGPSRVVEDTGNNSLGALEECPTECLAIMYFPNKLQTIVPLKEVEYGFGYIIIRYYNKIPKYPIFYLLKEDYINPKL